MRLDQTINTRKQASCTNNVYLYKHSFSQSSNPKFSNQELLLNFGFSTATNQELLNFGLELKNFAMNSTSQPRESLNNYSYEPLTTVNECSLF